MSRRRRSRPDKEYNLACKLDRKLLPSGERVKELLAACSQKGEMNRMQERVMVLLIKMGILEESACCTQEASREYKEALVLVDSLVS